VARFHAIARRFSMRLQDAFRRVATLTSLAVASTRSGKLCSDRCFLLLRFCSTTFLKSEKA
jgi:hypothetical protein